MNAEIGKGELVTIHEEKLPKGQWRLGKVEWLYEGNDGVVRGAELKVVSRTGKTTRSRCPVSKLYPLEVRSTSTSSDIDRRCDSQRGQLKVERPPRHKAAIDGELIRRLVNSEELKGECNELEP